MKKKKKRIFNKSTSAFSIVILIATMFLGIGYAKVSDVELGVDGLAIATPLKEVIITSIEFVSGNGVDESSQVVGDPYLTIMKSKLLLGNDPTSTITYKIKVRNNGDNLAYYNKAIFSTETGYDNEDIEFTVDGITLGDELQPNEEKEFTVTFKYKDSISQITNQELNSTINFKFDYENYYYHSDKLIFDGTNYIDTGIKLFSEKNIKKNFEISFTIDEYGSSMENLASIINSMYEVSPYPGFVFRLVDRSLEWELNAPSIGEENYNYLNMESTKTVVIKRINDIYYIQINDGNIETRGKYNSTTTFDVPVTIGASLDENSNPWRYFKGTLSNVTITLYDAEKYTIHYDANGGTGTMDDQIIRKDETTTLSSNAFAKDGKLFKEWNTNSDGSGTSYEDLEEVTNIAFTGQKITLYAIWADGFHYNVQFNANNGTEDKTMQEFIYTIKQPLSPNSFTKENHVFGGWNTMPDGSGTYYENEQIVKNLTTTENDVINLYAMWALKSYSNDGTYEFDGNTYINTGIYLFSRETIKKDFDISFEIVEIKSNNYQDTILSAMDETGEPWPGLLYRIADNSEEEIQVNVTSSLKTVKRYSQGTNNKVVLKRRSGIIYVNVNDGTDEQLLDMNSLNTTFDIPVTFGASLDENGDPWRFFEGTLRNLNITIYD